MRWWAKLKDRFWRFIDIDDRPYVEPDGIGIGWLWQLPDTHPFLLAAMAHDSDYDAMEAGTTTETTSGPTDWRFYLTCVRASADASRNAIELEKYLWEAKLFYGIVAAWGVVRWRLPDLADAAEQTASASPWQFDEQARHSRIARSVPAPKKLVGLRPELDAIARQVLANMAS